VALQVAETPWAQARARLATWETQAVQVTRRRVRWGGRRVDSAAREVTAAGWQDHGEIDWLITSLRLVGRAQADGELISIWWSGLAGAQVDPAGDAVDLDGSNGWRGHITGPSVAPIAVAAVAACHGPEVLPGPPRARPPSQASHRDRGATCAGAAHPSTPANSAADRPEAPDTPARRWLTDH